MISERPSPIAIQPAAAPPMSSPVPAPVEDSPAAAVPRWNWSDAMPLVWAIGFFALVLRLLAARTVLWKIERRATPLGTSGQSAARDRDTIAVAVDAACLQLGIRRPVAVLIHREKTIPMVWGLLRQRLLLPAAAPSWGGDQLRSVLLHELAHVKRRDMLGTFWPKSRGATLVQSARVAGRLASGRGTRARMRRSRAGRRRPPVGLRRTPA